MSRCSCRCSFLSSDKFPPPCSIHTLILLCMCVCTSAIFQSCFFFLSAVHLSSVARPKPIFASSWWQRGGDCQGGGPCLLGKRRYREFHKALAALWGQISGSCCVVWLICIYRMSVMQKTISDAIFKRWVCSAFILSSILLLACQLM